MRKIVLAGHHEGSPGAVAYNGKTEYEYNTELQDRLLTGDDVVTGYNGLLSHKISWVNQISKPRDMLLEIHFNHNHPTATGTEVFIHPLTTGKNKGVAIRMVNNISEAINIPIRRFRHSRDYKYPKESERGSLGIIEKTSIPAILIEVCFLNQIDLRKYDPEKVADAITESYK